MGTHSVIKNNDDRIIVGEHRCVEEHQQSPTWNLSHINTLFSYTLIHVTCCDPGPLNIIIEKVLHKGIDYECVTMITNMKVSDEPHPLGVLVNNIILPPGVGIEDHLSYKGEVQIQCYNHYDEILTRCARPRSQDTPLRLDIMTRFPSKYDRGLNKKMNDVSLKLRQPDVDDMIKTIFSVNGIVY